MNQEKRLKDFVPELIFGDRVISFEQFMDEMGGSGEIYDKKYAEILNQAVEANEYDWVEVSELVAPIVKEILIETVQEYPEIYRELMKFIQYSHLLMVKKAMDEELKSLKPGLYRIK